MERLISWREIQRHNKADDAWIVIDGKVWNLQLISSVMVFPVILSVTKIRVRKQTETAHLCRALMKAVKEKKSAKTDNFTKTNN